MKLLSHSAITAAGACAAALVLSVPALAVGPVPQTDQITVSSTFRFVVPFSCPDLDTCTGTVRVVTARAINPYSAKDPKRRELVAESDYSIASGAAKNIGFRMSGPAMAQLLKTGQLAVRLRVAPDGSDDVDRYAVMLTLPRP